MKTHEFAKALSTFAKILRAGPDIELEDLSLSSSYQKVEALKEQEIPAALYTLVRLNDVSKAQWLELIEEFGIDVEVRPRDANRDIVGKILSFLATNPEARMKLLKGNKRNISQSVELANALNLLLK